MLSLHIARPLKGSKDRDRFLSKSSVQNSENITTLLCKFSDVGPDNLSPLIYTYKEIVSLDMCLSYINL